MAIQRKTTRLGVSENLPNGSTYELLLVKVDGGYPAGQVSFEFLDTPRKITGIQKVAQLFLKVLLTQKGTDVLNPNLGTMFPELCISANRTQNDATFLSDVTLAVQDAEAQVRNITASLTGDTDSQLDKISILNLQTGRESLTLFVQVTTVAGITASIALPFPELDLKLANA